MYLIYIGIIIFVKMNTLIIYPENKEQLTAIKAIMKAMKVTFEQKSEVYPDYVIDGVKQSLRQADEGKLIPYTGIKDMLNLA
jgi:hypothetical protein